MAWTQFDAWNEAIVQEFLSGRFSQRPVYLDVDPEALATIAPKALSPEEARDALVEAVRLTLVLDSDRVQVFSQHEERLQRWAEDDRKSAPPIVALLAMFALIAEEMHEDSEFGGANYFGRLCKAVIVGETRSRLCEKLIRDFRQESHGFWDAYNLWLTDQEGVHGLPTAFAFDHRRHVGRAISQVLLREADRAKLVHLFRTYRLRPGQRLAVPDMRRIMDEWLPESQLSGRTKGLWSRGEEVRDRIAAVAAVELELWRGGIQDEEEEDDAPSGRIRLVGLLRRRPGARRLEISAKVKSSSRLPSGNYVLPPDASGPAVEALRDCAGSIHLIGGAEGWMEIKEASDVSIPDLILGPVELVHTGSPSTLRRDPRGLVVLLRNEEYGWFEERERAELATDALLLVHQALAPELLSLLEDVARPGFQAFRPDELQGVPLNWVLVADVQVMDVPNVDIRQEFRGLIPLSWSQVSVSAGLSLRGHQVWHTERPPEVLASSLLDRAVEVTLASDWLPHHPRIDLTLGTFSRAQVFDLSKRRLPDGNYTITLMEGTGSRTKYLLGQGMRLRSADSPALQRAEIIPMIHDLHELGWGTISASSTDTAPTYARGAMLVSDENEVRNATGSLPPLTLPRPEAEIQIEDDYEFAGPQVARSGATPGCLIGGGHHWLIQSVKPWAKPRWVDGYCKLCGLEKGFPGYPRRKGRRSSGPVRPRKADVNDPSDVSRVSPLVHSAIPSPMPVNLDLLFDSACYLRGGTWASFERLAAQMDDNPWFPLETGRMLSALGHLDLAFDRSTMRCSAWSIAPPVISSTEPNVAILSGFRSASMLTVLSNLASLFGGSMEIRKQDGAGPALVQVSGVDANGLNSLAREAFAQTGLEITVSERLPLRLLELAASIREVMSSLRPFVTPVGCATQKFDPRTARWSAVTRVDGWGAYRFGTTPARYGYLSFGVEQQRRVLSVDSRLAKYLAAYESQIPLVAYSPDSRVLSTRLGAQLPGLFERAIVLSTGRVPIQRRTGLVTYEGIDPEVARWLWRKLMGDGSTQREAEWAK